MGNTEIADAAWYQVKELHTPHHVPKLKTQIENPIRLSALLKHGREACQLECVAVIRLHPKRPLPRVCGEPYQNQSHSLLG